MSFACFARALGLERLELGAPDLMALLHASLEYMLRYQRKPMLTVLHEV
jgi:hypothetical protein